MTISPGELMIMGLLVLVIYAQTGGKYIIGFWVGVITLLAGLAFAAFAALAKLSG